MIKKLFLAFLLLAAPAWAQIDTAVGLSAVSCAGTCSVGNYTVPAAATDQILIVAPTVRYGTSNDLAGLTCSVGGVTATFSHRSNTGNAATQTALFYILDADLPAAGDRAVVCTDPVVTDMRSAMVRVQMLSGRVQAAPEQTNRNNATAATLSMDLTSVTADAVVLWVVGHTSDPGAESPAADVEFDAIDSRYAEGLAVVEVTGGSVGVDPSWANSVVSVGISASFAPETADVTPPTPGASGALTVNGATHNSLNVACTVGTDDVTAQADLEYEFRRSLSSNMGSVANAEANGTIVRAYTANDCTHTDTGLTSGVKYFYQVIIKDEAGNKAIHTTNSEAALVISDAGVVTCRCPALFDVPQQTLPNGQEEEVYAGATLVVLGGVLPRTWAIDSGTLPGGLSLDADTGIISGTIDAAEAGTHNFVVEVTDADGGLAYRQLTIVVDVAAAGSLAFYEDAEDGNLTADPAWTSAGGCAVTSTGVLEGANEVTKSTSTDCVLFDNVNESQVYFGFDVEFTTPSTARDEFIIGLGSSNEELFSCRYETDQDLFCKTPGQTGFETGGVPRGFYLGKAGTTAGDEGYVEIHYIAGTGANATFEARLDGGAIQTFSAGTATANVDRIILRDDNDGAGDFIYDRLEAKDDAWPGRAPLTPPDPPPTPDPPGVWVNNFVPTRIHYVSTSGTGVGTIGDPESMTTAFSSSHYQCGDLHHFRSGTYSIGVDRTFSVNCNSAAPAVFKGYVDPATGEPETVKWNGTIVATNGGAWNWVVGIEQFDTVSTSAKSNNIRAPGFHFINSVIHDLQNGSNVGWWNAGPGGPNMQIYGSAFYRPGCNGPASPAHNVYANNNFTTQGWKYFIQNISLEPCPHEQSRRLFQAYDGTGNRGISGFHLEKNFFGDESDSDGETVLFNHPNGTPTHHTILKSNFFVDFYHDNSDLSSVQLGVSQPMTAEVTNNYFARANVAPYGYWGNAGTHDVFIFTGNEIYDPPGGVHIKGFQTRGTSGAVGSHKILDADDWDDNIYGGTFQGQLFCNSTNSGTLSLANWRTATDACRVTPASAVGFDINSTNPANPTTDKVTVVVNEYQCSIGCPFTDQARGNIYAVNWDGNSTVSANISTVVGVGKTYTIRYPRDFFGTPATSGTCPGAGACTVSLPTKRTDAEASGKFANVYIITAQP